MTTEERKTDIVNANLGIEMDELRTENNQLTGVNFKSIEYWFILHLTNQELYYMDSESLKAFEGGADIIQDTDKGRIFLMS